MLLDSFSVISTLVSLILFSQCYLYNFFQQKNLAHYPFKPVRSLRQGNSKWRWIFRFKARVKTYLRSTTGDARLNHLVILHEYNVQVTHPITDFNKFKLLETSILETPDLKISRVSMPPDPPRSSRLRRS